MTQKVLLLPARKEGKPPSLPPSFDGVHLNLNYPEGLAAACAQGRHVSSLPPSPPPSFILRP